MTKTRTLSTVFSNFGVIRHNEATGVSTLIGSHFSLDGARRAAIQEALTASWVDVVNLSGREPVSVDSAWTEAVGRKRRVVLASDEPRAQAQAKRIAEEESALAHSADKILS